VRYGRQTLGISGGPFFYTLVPTVVETFGEAFPELRKNPQAVMDELREEEESFGKTLDRGIALFNDAAERAQQKTIAAADAFQLHDTYGFPLDLTQLMAEERGMTVDVAGFEKLMEDARERSRSGSSTSGGAKQSLVDAVQKLLLKDTEFVGYDTTELPPQAMGVTLFKLTGSVYEHVNQLAAGDEGAIVTDKSPFYGESGGQVGDTGAIQIGSARFTVTDTQKVGNVIFHLGKLLAGAVEAGGPSGPLLIALAVDKSRRAAIMANHTTTHVMNRALRDRVNTEANQRGSLVNEHYLRFDFSHNSALSEQEVEAVEKQVNADIAANLPVSIDYAPQDKAIRINGLRAVFGEKYPPTVRVVSIGAKVSDLLADPSSSKWADKSTEFCGGTHLRSTGSAERFAIISQESVSKGVRRLTAYTGHAAAEAQRAADQLDKKMSQLLQAPPESLAGSIDAIQREIDEATLPLRARASLRCKLTELQEKIKQFQKAQGAKQSEAVVEHARAIADSAGSDSLVVAEIPGADANTLRTAMDVIRKKLPGAAMFLLSAPAPDKVALIASVPEQLVKKGLKAGDWVKHVAPIVGGGGGGRPDMAQAGGKDASKLKDAIETAKQFAQKF
jgi:alanyl-tRNA synthetase